MLQCYVWLGVSHIWKIISLYFLRWCGCHIKQLKYQSNNSQNRRSDEIVSRVFETYHNYISPHGCHIHNTESYMAMAIMCPCPSLLHYIPHWKCLLRYFDKYPSIFIPIQEANRDTPNTYPTITFNVYINISCFTLHGIHPHK